MKKQIISILLAGLMLFATACSSSGGSDSAAAQQSEGSGGSTAAPDGQKTAIRYVSDVTEDAAYGKELFPLMDKFREDNPDIELSYEFALDADLKTKIKTEAAADMLPELFYFWTTYSNALYLYEADVILEFETIRENSKVITDDMFPEDKLEEVAYNGVYYGLPVVGSRSFFLLNKSLYDQYGVPYPETYEEFREGGKVFLENGIIPLSVGFKDGNPGHQWFSVLMNQLKDGSQEMQAVLTGANLRTPSGNLERVMQILQEDAELGMYPKDFINGDWNTQQALFFEGKAAAMYSLSFQLQSCPEELVDDMMMWHVPKLADAVRDPSTYFAHNAQNGLMVSKKAFYESDAKKDAIMRFVDFYLGEEHITALAKYQELYINYPLDSSVFPPLVQQMYEYQQGMEKAPALFSTIPDPTAFNDFKIALQEGASRMLTPEQFADKVETVFDEIAA